jgi:glycosyltransferase involved in cell wall biosynthesis
VTAPPAARTKILYVIGTLGVGGSETQLVQLVTHLDRERFEPVVCSLFSGGELVAPLRQQGIRVHVLEFDQLPGGRFRWLAALPRAAYSLAKLWRIIRRERPVILHGVLLWAYIFGAYLGRLCGVPFIVAGRRSLGLFKADKPHYLFLERMANRMTDVFIANSEAVREDSTRRENIPPSKMIVIHNGLDVSRFRADPAEELVGEPLLRRGPRVIVVSNLIYYKGHDVFFRAWKRVVERFPTAVALLVGDGARRDPLVRLAEELGIAPSVRFLGVRSDVPALLAAADVFVHPSLQEGFSNAVLEAMAAGKAIVATAVGGNPEAIADGETGLLVPPGDPDALARGIVRLLEDAEAARRMGERARALAIARHDIRAMARRYEAVYDGLLARRPVTQGAA